MKKVARFSRMAQTSNKLASELVTIGKRLVSIGQGLAGEVGETPAPPPDIQDKLSRYECLQRGEICPPPKRMKRGLCLACYQRTMSAIAKHLATEEELIAKGLISPEINKGGRKVEGADPLSDLIRVRTGGDKELALVGEAKKKRKSLEQMKASGKTK